VSAAQLKYGLIYHFEVRSQEVQELQRNHHKPFMFWLFLRVSIFRTATTWPISTTTMARKFDVDRRSIQRWSQVLEDSGLLRREVPIKGRDTQRFTLLHPPSVRDALAKLGQVQTSNQAPNDGEREKLQEELQGLYQALENGQDYGDAWKASMRDMIAELELRLEALTD